ncbi:hypothetical protein [Methylomonas albis]|uniref:Uncharacterized protein n=1 Tax=Methylomonas albis TaxID=1854563 RepID=A0ABR9CZ31_9GAMM|nr:hypothetical protein [Methylomonas albis]MBD9355960.1 hypothetical protein [Methylomonas albis]CAD6878996.1 hypothetical protein [Methylomonas albis]
MDNDKTRLGAYELSINAEKKNDYFTIDYCCSSYLDFNSGVFGLDVDLPKHWRYPIARDYL